MTEYLWGAVLARGQTLFGEPPGPALEQRVLAHFQTEPNRVTNLIESIGKRVAAGTVTSGWAILDKELARAHPDVRADDSSEKTQQILLVETWLRTTGGHIDNEAELLDEVFGPRGRLYLWDKDEPLIAHILELWHEQRPRFQAAEAEQLERLHTQGETYRRLRKTMRYTANDLEPDEHAHRIATEIERARLAYLESLRPDDEPDQPAGTLDPD